MQPTRLLCPWDLPGKSTGEGVPSPSPASPALEGIFLTTRPQGKSHKLPFFFFWFLLGLQSFFDCLPRHYLPRDLLLLPVSKIVCHSLDSLSPSSGNTQQTNQCLQRGRDSYGLGTLLVKTNRNLVVKNHLPCSESGRFLKAGFEMSHKPSPP